MGSNVRKYTVTARLAFHNSVSTFHTAIASLLSSLAILGALFAIYRYSFGEVGGSVHGVSVAAAVWALSMYSVYWAIGMRNVYKDVTDQVRDGTLETFLNKPVNYPLYIISNRFGRQVMVMIINVVLNTLLCLAFVGLPPVHPSPLVFLECAALLLGGVILGAFTYLLVGMCSFWLEESTPVMWMVDKSVMILGGAFVPVALFPPLMRTLAEWSPFGAMMSFSQVFYGAEFLVRFPELMLAQVLWIAALALLAIVMWSRARKRMFVNGG